MAVPPPLLPPVGLRRSYRKPMPLGGRRPCTRSIHWPDRSARAARFLFAASHCVSKRPIWLGEAARHARLLPTPRSWIVARVRGSVPIRGALNLTGGIVLPMRADHSYRCARRRASACFAVVGARRPAAAPASDVTRTQ